MFRKFSFHKHIGCLSTSQHVRGVSMKRQIKCDEMTHAHRPNLNNSLKIASVFIPHSAGQTTENHIGLQVHANIARRHDAIREDDCLRKKMRVGKIIFCFNCVQSCLNCETEHASDKSVVYLPANMFVVMQTRFK